MTLPSGLILIAAIGFEILGTSLLSSTNHFTRLGPTAAVALSYTASFWLLSVVLRTVPIGIAYAIWSGVGVAAITLIGWVFFSQKLDAAALIGIGMIAGGVVVLNLFSGSVSH